MSRSIDKIVESLKSIDRSDILVIRFLDIILNQWTDGGLIDQTKKGKKVSNLLAEVEKLREEFKANEMTVDQYNKLNYEDTDRLLSQKIVIFDRCQAKLGGLFINRLEDRSVEEISNSIPDLSMQDAIKKSKTNLGQVEKRMAIDKPIRIHIEEFKRLSPGSINVKIRENNKLILAFIRLRLETVIIKKF
jgi:hypothetical protein